MADDLFGLPIEERVKRLRVFAKKALDSADGTNDLVAKETYISTARRWEQMARELERAPPGGSEKKAPPKRGKVLSN